ncbi:unnamed protein product [Arctia plantaginis]|uniref:Uncharacterized protein n=1 Tax=Arctia plantaginis TaxID=874455 RepID=A0A8S0ZLK0_ARCPL|nr:unnamed protein product [Arctia plantaginis]
MESSSEDSFTWTDTSSDSIESQPMPAVERPDKNLRADKHTRRSDCKEAKLRHDTEELSHKQLNCGTRNSAQNNMVKVEPESDCDIPRKKKKNKHVEVNSNENGLPGRDSNCYDESYLDLKVKQEEMAASLSGNKIKKKRNLSESAEESQTDVKKCRVKEPSPDSHNESQSSQLDKEIKTKKKKKKSKRRRESETQEEIESSCYKDCEDTVSKEEIASHSSSQISRMEDTLVTDNTFGNESYDDISAIQSDDHNIHTLSFNSGENVESKNKGESLYKTAIINQFKMDNHDEAEATHNRRPRLSDRIRFEDDSETEVSQTYNNASDMTPVKLKKFIKTIDNMKLISQELSHSSTLTCDDELWIVHCPKDIDVEGFCDADLNINGKSKMKVGGQTYDGTLDSEGCDTTAVLTMGDAKYQINNLPLSGIIKFRKRIPKAHFHDDNIMVNNQTNFIPLPETKCRHPLFGSNYKKALKIPSAIAQQLNLQNEPEETFTTEKRRKKKHKKDTNNLKHEETDSKCEVITILEPEVMLKGSEKKRKKRKHLDDEGPAPKKVKKFKHDPESAEAWESEKAIEQNLFSF